jgi:chromate reductase, NAD(P)H dehydrogenase (quinone)
MQYYCIMPAAKNIIAIPGSLRHGSASHHVLAYLGSLMPQEVNFTIYDGIGSLPHFDPGLDNDSPPPAVAAFRGLLAGANGVVICTPEYAFGVPGSLKNALDWTVGSGSLAGKPLALITASTGGENAHAALMLILKHALAADIPADGSLLIPFIRSKLDGAGNITDAGTKLALEKVVSVLLNAIR